MLCMMYNIILNVLITNGLLCLEARQFALRLALDVIRTSCPIPILASPRLRIPPIFQAPVCLKLDYKYMCSLVDVCGRTQTENVFGELPPNKNVMVTCSLLSSSIIRIELSLYIGSTSVRTVDKVLGTSPRPVYSATSKRMSL